MSNISSIENAILSKILPKPSSENTHHQIGLFRT